MKNKAEKKLLIRNLNEIFSSAVTGILIDYKGFTVEEITNLRKDLYQKESKLKVIKNSLAKIAVKDTPFEKLSDYFIGTRALVYSTEDVTGPAKIVTEQIKKKEFVKLIGGLLVSQGKGELLEEAEIKALGNLPGREELLSKLLFLMNAPITNFVRTLNEVPAGFVRLLQAVADSKDK